MERADDRFASTDVVAGLLAAGSAALSGVAMGGGLLLQLEPYPLRTAVAAMALAVVAGRMSERFAGAALKAAVFAGFAFVIGMTIAALTTSPLF